MLFGMDLNANVSMVSPRLVFHVSARVWQWTTHATDATLSPTRNGTTASASALLDTPNLQDSAFPTQLTPILLQSSLHATLPHSSITIKSVACLAQTDASPAQLAINAPNAALSTTSTSCPLFALKSAETANVFQCSAMMETTRTVMVAALTAKLSLHTTAWEVLPTAKTYALFTSLQL